MSATPSRWRNRVFVLTFTAVVVPWLAVVAWVTWLVFFPALNWVERQNEFLQEIFGALLVLAWALFLGVGVGAAAMLAERVAGTRHFPLGDVPGKTHGTHAAWQRPDRS